MPRAKAAGPGTCVRARTFLTAPPTETIVTDAPDVRPFAEIARGPVATVYKAFDSASGEVVLLKRVHAADPERRQRFAEEARLAAGVDHPNVVRVLHAGDDTLVAEWVEGEDLAAVVDRCGALPAELATLVAREAALGLSAVHAAGVLHRDVSARNVMVGADGRVRLTDFGLASLADARDDEVRGTLGTLAPELVRGEPADARSDLFSLGAVLFHALSGRPPFEGGDASRTLDAVLHDDPAAGLASDPRLPPALASVTATLLAKDPAARPTSAADAATRLSAVLDALGAPQRAALATFLDAPAAYEPPPRPPPAETSSDVPPPDVAPDRPPPPPSRRRRPRWPIVAGLSGVAGLVALALLLPERAAEPAERPQEPVPVPVEIAAVPTDPAPIEDEDDPAEEVPAPEAALAPAPVDDDPTPPPEPQPTAPPDSPAVPAVRPADERSVPEPPAPAPATTGRLSVAAQPWARVRVGARDLGTTPIAAVELPVGQHTVTLTNPEFPPHTLRVRVEPGEQTEAVVSLWDHVGRVTVVVAPWAEVAVDGEYWDTTPQERPLILAPGDHVLTFTHPAFGAQERRLRVAAGERRTVRVRMNED